MASISRGLEHQLFQFGSHRQWRQKGKATGFSPPLKEAYLGRTQRGVLGVSLKERFQSSVAFHFVHGHKNIFVRGVINAQGSRTKKNKFGGQKLRMLGNASCPEPVTLVLQPQTILNTGAAPTARCTQLDHRGLCPDSATGL